MLDLETMGDTPYSPIMSISAVVFDMDTAEIGEVFERKATLQSNFDLGLYPTASTIEFWMRQPDEARLELLKNDGSTLYHALSCFSEWMASTDNSKSQIWGNSARFDCGILKDAYYKSKMPIPWDFRLERDVRTLVAFDKKIKENTTNTGVAHNGVDDCKFQIAYCTKIWKKYFLDKNVKV